MILLIPTYTSMNVIEINGVILLLEQIQASRVYFMEKQVNSKMPIEASCNFSITFLRSSFET